jgi:hypothetical protein
MVQLFLKVFMPEFGWLIVSKKEEAHFYVEIIGFRAESTKRFSSLCRKAKIQDSFLEFPFRDTARNVCPDCYERLNQMRAREESRKSGKIGRKSWNTAFL